MDDVPNMPTGTADENSAYDRYASDEGYYTELMSFLSESHSMRVTAKSAVKQSLYAASGAFAGSFIGGPLGGLLGGIAGSVIGYVKSDNFDGAIVALTKLESARQKRLMSEVFDVMKKAGASYKKMQDSGAFHDSLHRFAEQESVRNGIWNACLHSTRT